MPIKGWTIRWLSCQHSLSITLPVFHLSSQQLFPIPLVRHQFNRSDVILGRKNFPTSAIFVIPSVSAQFLRLQNSTFDKSSIPTLTHSRMEITSLSFPLYSYPPYDLTIKTNKDKNTKTSFGYSRVVLRQPRQNY